MPDPQPRRQIPDQRKALYYLGNVLRLIGLLMFCSVFVMGCVNFGNFDNFEGQAKNSMGLALGGMAVAVVGSVLASLGQRGLAGSGVLLDPERQRKDLEPWSRMAGGMVEDALDEAGGKPAGPAPAVKIRCPACKALNEEHARFCSQCGKPVG